jgi:C-terminal processing protease CtpA/Prc
MAMYAKLAISARAAGLVALLILAPDLCWPDQISKHDRDLAQDMLQQISADIKKHYYDPNFHGLDWDAIVQQAKERIDKSADLNRAMSEVAAALDALHDSHTFLLPPPRPFRHAYGWQLQMIGDHCYVIHVHPGSDAEGKGIKPGDEVLSINGYAPSRDNFWMMEYVYNILRPQAGLHVSVADPTGHQREIDVMAKMTQLKRVADLSGGGNGSDFWDMIREMEGEDSRMRPRYVEAGDELMILKIHEFEFSESDVRGMIARARKHKSLILDLRGNPGGAVESLKYLVAGMFENDLKIGDRTGRDRDATKPMIAKTHGHDQFTGKLAVLIDSKSASAAELFARVIQIEKRGVVLGDKSSGSVMESKRYSYRLGADTVIFFGASITDADLIMGDGKSLERAGVSPDRILLPAAADLANGRDPVLALATETRGYRISPEQAGKMFPYEWAGK